MSNNPGEVIAELYRAFHDRDDDAFRALCHPQIEWIQNEGFPGGTTSIGADAVLKNVFHRLSREWDSWKVEIDQTLECGSTVVILGRYTGTHEKTGKSFSAPAAHVYEVEDGLIRRYRQYTDTWLIREAMRSE